MEDLDLSTYATRSTCNSGVYVRYAWFRTIIFDKYQNLVIIEDSVLSTYATRSTCNSGVYVRYAWFQTIIFDKYQILVIHAFL